MLCLIYYFREILRLKIAKGSHIWKEPFVFIFGWKVMTDHNQE